MLQQGHVENRVDLHRVWEPEPDSIRGAEAGVGGYFKRAVAAVTQFLRRLAGGDVSGV